jgi:hypothetical protein
LATGTHGQGLRNAGLYDSIVELEIILADGIINKITRTDENFHAFQIHLGCLGVIVGVTLECEPLVVFKVSKEIKTYDSLIESFQHWNESSTHCKAWWFPNTNHVQLWRSNPASDSEIKEYNECGAKLLKLNHNLNDAGSSNSFSKSIDDLLQILKLDTSSGSEVDAVIKTDYEKAEARYRTLTRFRSLEQCIGDIYQIWCKGIPAPQGRFILLINLKYSMKLNFFS